MEGGVDDLPAAAGRRSRATAAPGYVHGIVADSVEVLAAKQAITEVLHRYCYAVDRMDKELGAQIWHPGGLAHYGNDIFDGTGEDFIEQVFQQHALADATSHQVTNVAITVDGDRATSECYVTACIRFGAKDIVVRGRYADTWSCRGGEWRIDERWFHPDLMQIVPVDDSPLF